MGKDVSLQRFPLIAIERDRSFFTPDRPANKCTGNGQYQTDTDIPCGVFYRSTFTIVSLPKSSICGHPNNKSGGGSQQSTDQSTSFSLHLEQLYVLKRNIDKWIFRMHPTSLRVKANSIFL